MSTFWENGAKYQEYKNKADARKTVILLFLFFTQKQMLSSCIWMPDVWEHDLVRWLYQIISGLKQCFRCCAMRFIAWVIHYPITWSIEAKSHQFFCCALRNLFSKCVYLPVFNYFKTSIQHFFYAISQNLHKNTWLETQVLTFPHDDPNTLYSLFCETQVCVFSTRQKCKVHAHFMHFHSMDRYPVKERQNVQGFPTCILDRLQPL